MKVSMIVAISVDGFIAKEPSLPSTKWTSSEDKKHFVTITKSAGVVVMGKNTFNTIGKALPGRRTIVYSNTPIGAQNIEITSLEPKDLIAKLEKEGVREVVICGGQTIYTMFMETKLIDKIYVTIEPVFFGKGLSIFGKEIQSNVELVSAKKQKKSLFLEFNVIK
jgi:dihydrofolate reductase